MQAFERGDLVWYRQRDGTFAEAKVCSGPQCFPILIGLVAIQQQPNGANAVLCRLYPSTKVCSPIHMGSFWATQCERRRPLDSRRGLGHSHPLLACSSRTTQAHNKLSFNKLQAGATQQLWLLKAARTTLVTSVGMKWCQRQAQCPATSSCTGRCSAASQSLSGRQACRQRQSHILALVRPARQQLMLLGLQVNQEVRFTAVLTLGVGVLLSAAYFALVIEFTWLPLFTAS